MNVGEIWEHKSSFSDFWNKIIQIKITKIENDEIFANVIRNDSESFGGYRIRTCYPVKPINYFDSSWRKTTSFNCDFVLCRRNENYLPKRDFMESFECFNCRN